MDLENRIKAYRFVAYSAVTFSVVAVLSVCVTLPMVYNYVHHVRRQMHSEITYCKVSIFMKFCGVFSWEVFCGLYRFFTGTYHMLKSTILTPELIGICKGYLV